jgi:pyruvate kinase
MNVATPIGLSAAIREAPPGGPAERERVRRNRCTKIIATLGPASATPDVLARLFQGGADVFRLNFSHGSHDDHRERIGMIRDLERKVGRPIGILADIQGPKLRVGRFSGGRVQLVAGQRLVLDLNPTPGDATRVNLPHPEIMQAAAIGTTLLLDDGKLRLRVLRQRDGMLETEVTVGGPLSDRKGVNVPDVVLPIPALTLKDRADLAFVLDQGVDYIGLSFVQRPEDVAEARAIAAGRAWIMTKIEKPQALENLEEIVRLSDAVMVARGDLGVELPPEEVPLAQKRIVRVARQFGRPVVVATQMLESMIGSPAPTRAEASDVATAVFDGADAVMLSAESAAGQYPYEAVNMMDRIVTRVERDPGWRAMIEASRPAPECSNADAIAAAARQVAHTIRAVAICAYSAAGGTALRAARERPEAPIISLTPDAATARRLALVWGVHAAVSPDTHTVEAMVASISRLVVHTGLAPGIADVVLLAGMRFGQAGGTDQLHIVRVG